MTARTLYTTAEVTDGVLSAALKLRTSGSDPERVDYATAILIERLEAGLAAAGPARQGFDTEVDPPDQPTEDVFAIAASQLSMAAVALAADIGNDADFATALYNLGGANNALQEFVGAPRTQGFESTSTTSPDLPAAVIGLREATETTLLRIESTGADLVERLLKSLPEVIPLIRTAWDSVTKTLDVAGLRGQVTRLARLALRLVAAALDRLSTLVPTQIVPAARDRIRSLVDRLEQQQPVAALFGSAIDADAIRTVAANRLQREGLDKSRLDSAADSVAALSDRYGRYMSAANSVADGLNVLHRIGGYLAPVAPQFPAATAGAHVVVLVGVVAVSLDFLDAGTDLGFVRGVRQTILDATE